MDFDEVRKKVREDIRICNDRIRAYQERKRSDMKKLERLDFDEYRMILKEKKLSQDEAKDALMNFRGSSGQRPEEKEVEEDVE